jgi:hypothetical protein
MPFSCDLTPRTHYHVEADTGAGVVPVIALEANGNEHNAVVIEYNRKNDVLAAAVAPLHCISSRCRQVGGVVDVKGRHSPSQETGCEYRPLLLKIPRYVSDAKKVLNQTGWDSAMVMHAMAHCDDYRRATKKQGVLACEPRAGRLRKDDPPCCDLDT